MKLTEEYKERVRLAILEDFKRFGGSAKKYAVKLGVADNYISRFKAKENPMKDEDTLRIGLALGVSARQDNWKVVRTPVYNYIEQYINQARATGSCFMLVDKCGIGKTFCAKHIIRQISNAFYVDCSLHKTKASFIKAIARELGLETRGNASQVLRRVIDAIPAFENPIIILDETGDLNESAFLELKAIINGANKACAFFMMGADGLRARLERGVKNEKVGYPEIMSRFSDVPIQATPEDTNDLPAYMGELVYQVAKGNGVPTEAAKKLARKSAKEKRTLRYVETTIKLNYA